MRWESGGCGYERERERDVEQDTEGNDGKMEDYVDAVGRRERICDPLLGWMSSTTTVAPK